MRWRFGSSATTRWADASTWLFVFADIVMSSICCHEHTRRSPTSPIFTVLSWDRTFFTYLLDQKVTRLSSSFFIRRSKSSNGGGLARFGLRGLRQDGADLMNYLLRHTARSTEYHLLGGTVIGRSCGKKNAAKPSLKESLFKVVSRCAKQFGDAQLAQCGNQVLHV